MRDPFGHFIVRRAKTLAFSDDNTAIEPLGPEFEYASWDHEFDFRGCSDSTPVVDARNLFIVATAMNGAMCSAEGMVLDGSNDYVAVTPPWEFGGAMTMEAYFSLRKSGTTFAVYFGDIGW